MIRPSGYTSIPKINGDDLKPEDIETFEKVLKFCADSNGLAFTPDQAIMTMSGTSNILRWKMGMPIKTMTYPSYCDRRFVAVDELRNRIVIVECRGEPDAQHLKYLRDIAIGDDSRFPVVDSWGMTETERNAARNPRRPARY